MPRPFRQRRVKCRPVSGLFKPRGIPASSLEEVNLTMDELEAIRLADLEGKYQEEAAKEMNISRQTLGNILTSAHKKIADSLLNGKAVRIEGGEIELDDGSLVCRNSDKKSYSSCLKEDPDECPAPGTVKCKGGHKRGKGIKQRCRRM